MNFLQRIGNALSRFMYGRNGADQLGLTTIWAALLLDVANMFIKQQTVHLVISFLSTVLLVIAAFRVARGSKDVVVMKRRVDTGMLLRALSITVISLMVICLGAFLIALVDGLTFEDVLFETFSAFGTVGVTTGITTQFSYFGKLLLMAMMFFGRVGILTITYEIMVGLHGEKDPLRRPKAELLIG